MKENAPKLGKLIEGEAFKDAIHIAVAPVVAGMSLSAGSHVMLVDGKAMQTNTKGIGVVDPFLKTFVPEGASFYLFLYPGSITGLRHLWSHPAFDSLVEAAKIPDDKSPSIVWMRKWAKQHMAEDYYGDEGHVSDDIAYERAIQAGHDMSVGPHEDSRDYIDGEWWNHWEIITGEKGEREGYFSCSC